eukprot:8782272-Pyramimonas_sp.AAC.1
MGANNRQAPPAGSTKSTPLSPLPAFSAATTHANAGPCDSNHCLECAPRGPTPSPHRCDQT